MALPGTPPARRAQTAIAVRSEDWDDDESVDSDAAALVFFRVRGLSAGVARFTRATNSSRGSRTDDRQVRRHCCVEEARVAIQPRAGAASAIRGKRRRRARASHVCSGSAVCSRQVRARAQVEEAAMVTLRSLGSCVASSWRMSRPWGAARTAVNVFAPWGRSSLPRGPPALPRSTTGSGTLPQPLTAR